jgi:hypothetical protein
MLRLDPRHPPLWRDADTLQFGLDDVARLEDVQPWEERLVDRLVRGASELEIEGVLRSARVPRAAVDAFFAELQPVLHPVIPGPGLLLAVSHGLDRATVEAVAGVWERAGARVRIDPWPDAVPAPEADETVVLVSAHVADPRRAAGLVSADLPHLPLVFDAAGATVGPLVRPGETACLACDAAHARDRDPAWPVVASQLVGRPCAIDPDLAVEAARAALQVVTAAPTPLARSLRVDASRPTRTWRSHPPHEDCGCRSLEGIGREPAARDRVPATSSPTAIARPA